MQKSIHGGLKRHRPARGWAWLGLLMVFCLLAAPTRAQAPPPPIVIGLDRDYPPYEFVSPQGQVEGYNVDLVQAVARVMGLKIELRPGVWGELRDDLAAGRIQALTTMLKSPERQQVFSFCEPPLEVHYSLFARKGLYAPRKLEELQGRKVLIQRGSQMHEHLLSHGFQDAAVPVESELEALRQLAAGKQDAALAAHLTGMMAIRQGGLGNIQPVGKPVLTRELCMVVRKDNPELLERLNTGLAILRKTGEYEQIRTKWFGELEGPDPRTRRMLQGLAIAAAILLILLAGALAWNRALQRRILHHTREIQAHKDFLQAVIDSLPLMLFAKDPNQNFAFSLWNRKAEEMTGVRAEALLGSTDAEHFPPEQAMAFRKADEEVMAGGELRVIEEEPLDTARGQILLRTLKVPLRDREGRPLQLLGISEDITERKRIEQGLAQVQRLESLGVMAGGIAHNFNNYLMGIQGNLDLAACKLPAEHPALPLLRGAGQSVLLASNLANQMLAYAGQGSYQVRPLDLNQLITDMDELLQAMLPRQASLRIELDPKLPPARADERQMQQVLLNLVANASEALGSTPGNITISTRPEWLRAEAIPGRFPGQSVSPGLHAVIRIQDDGCGMAPEILAHLFDPFYTTKFTGRGLGLAAVQGILKSHGGAILVDSQADRGSTLEAFLPALADRT